MIHHSVRAKTQVSTVQPVFFSLYHTVLSMRLYFMDKIMSDIF